jgi:hypothetical protein
VVVLRQPEEPDSAYIYFKVLQNWPQIHSELC